MNVDKFGHHIHKRQRFTDIEQNCALKNIGDLNLSVQYKRLKHLKNPIDLYDAATKEYTDLAIADFWNKNIPKVIDQITNKIEELKKEQNQIIQNEQTTSSQ